VNKMTFLTPARLDSFTEGKLADPQTPGLFLQANRRGRRTWRYRRRIASSNESLKLTLGLYPAFSLAGAREWAASFNAQIEAGVDPRAVARAEAERAILTVSYTHERYMAAVREGRGSRAKKINKPRTIADKLAIFRCDIEPKLGDKLILDITEKDLTKLVLDDGYLAMPDSSATLTGCLPDVRLETISSTWSWEPRTCRDHQSPTLTLVEKARPAFPSTSR
jgi:hypothetical protein